LKKAAARRLDAKAAKPRKTAPKSQSRRSAKPARLAGGNPQIAKGYGDAPVQAGYAGLETRRRAPPRRAHHAHRPWRAQGGQMELAVRVRGAVHWRRLDVSFDINGGIAEAFRVPQRLADLQACRQPGRNGVARLPPRLNDAFGRTAALRERIGVSDATSRLSMGIEHPDDLIADLSQALVTGRLTLFVERAARVIL
jgi:hypothetical protein